MSMRSIARGILARIGGSLPLVPITQPPSKTILMYHGVSQARDEHGLDAATFEAQIALLSRNVKFVRANEVANIGESDLLQVALTFDDGYRNNAETVAPILRRYGVPATFFICHRNTHLQKPTWFTYLKVLERYYHGHELRFLDHVLDMSPGQRRRSVKYLESLLMAARPHPSAMYHLIEEELPSFESLADKETLNDEFTGMTEDQIRALGADPLFDLGAHTMDHPMLSLCDDAEMKRQIADNKEWLALVSGRRVDSIAYPNGDCNPEIVRFCRSVGFRTGYCVGRQFGEDAALEVRRAGIYYPSLFELRCKVRSTDLMASVTRLRPPGWRHRESAQ
jgi:peptidoglycan/xylan/chitin deacetylase (PgdA/CDA1 family)